MTTKARVIGLVLFLSALGYLPGTPAPANAQAYVPWSPIPDTGCSGYSTSVIPIGLTQGAGGRYLSYGGDPGTRVIPIGASPDNGAALYLNDTNLISQSIAWQAVLDNLSAAGLNRLRVWVAFGLANDPRNTPFRHQTDAAFCPPGLVPCFRLDQRNIGFFNRLRGVVNEARKRKMFVEFTFFSPFWGDTAGSTFEKGPWGGKGAYLAGDGTIKAIKFTSKDNFVLDAQTGDNLRMQTSFQANVIRWTIAELWCFDNIWYEIANEPEKPDMPSSRVANWQKSLIANYVVPEDSTQKFPWLQRPHLTAVNVSSKTTTAEFLGPNNPNVSIVNGHYTEIDNGYLDSGALIYLADGNLTVTNKVLGFNETKITGSGGGDFYTRSLTNGGTVQYGGPEAGRAEAWEFMLTRGGTVDHFGYLVGGTIGPIASQMDKLRSFMSSLALAPLRASTDPATGFSPPWVNIGRHPDPMHGVFPAWDATRRSYKYWGALQTPDGTTASPNRVFVLYLHNSAPRCKENNDLVNYDPTGRCSTHGYLRLNSYDARIWTTTKYQESNLALKLGAASGTFRICWFDPASLTVLSQQTCNWNGTSCGFAVTSPPYQYDILLKIDEKPLPCS